MEYDRSFDFISALRELGSVCSEGGRGSVVVLSTSISELSIIGHVPIDNLERLIKISVKWPAPAPVFASQAITHPIPPTSTSSDTATTSPPNVVRNFHLSYTGRYIAGDDPCWHKRILLLIYIASFCALLTLALSHASPNSSTSTSSAAHLSR